MNNFKKKLLDNSGIIVLFLLGLLLRAYCLGLRSFWYDEAVVLLEAQKNLIALFHINSEGIHPPLYRLIMHFWLYLGQSEGVIRIPSLIFSSISIIVGYKIVKLIFNKRVALYTALFITVSPFHIYYAQEVKSYSLFFLLSLASLYFFIKVTKENKIGLWLGYIFFTALSIYAHYFSFLSIFAQNLFLIFNYKRHEKGLLKKWVTAQCLVFLLFIPGLSACVQHVRRVTGNFWIPPVSGENIFIVFKNFTLGYYTSNFNFVFMQCLLGIIFLSGIRSLMFSRLNEQKSFYWESSERLTLLLSYLSIPIIILALSKIIRPLFLDRALIVISFFYYIILSKGLEAMRKNKIIFFLVVFLSIILVTVSLKNYYEQNNFSATVGVASIKKQFREAMRYVSSNYRQGDKVILSHYSSWPVFEYYRSQNTEIQLYLENPFGCIDEDDKYSRVLLKYLNFRIINMDWFKEKENAGIWIICSGWGDSPFVSSKLQEWMDAHRKYLSIKNDRFSGIKLYYFN